MGVAAIALVLVALICACLMGYAIQRGATCMVAAVEEIVSKRRLNRLVAMLEASAIVAAGIILARFAGILDMDPAEFGVTVATMTGGALLGLGAFWNRACVFGSVARLGSGEWAYMLSPVGFLLGCVIAFQLLGPVAPMQAEPSSLLLAASLFGVGPLVLIAGWRVWRTIEAGRKGELLAYAWSSHVATGIIGLTFVVMLLAVGPWAYTDLLAETARGMPMNVAMRLILLAGLFGGALLGGWTAGRLRLVRPDGAAIARCLGGGALMGIGSMLVPGSNDGLILIGMPLLQPHAWVALASMVMAIAAAFFVERRLTLVASRPEMA